MSYRPDVMVCGKIEEIFYEKATDVWDEKLKKCVIETDHPDFPLIEASISFRKGDRKIRVKNGQKARVTMMWWKPPGGRKAKWVVRSWEILTPDEPDSSHVFAPEPEEEVPEEDGVDYHFTKEVPKGPASYLDDDIESARATLVLAQKSGGPGKTGPASFLDDAWLPEKDGAPFEPEVDAGRGVDLPEKVEASDFPERIRALQTKEGPERPVPLVSGRVDLKETPPSDSLEDPPADCAFDPPPADFSEVTKKEIFDCSDPVPQATPPSKKGWFSKLFDKRKKR